MTLVASFIVTGVILYALWKLTVGPLLKYRRFLNKIGQSPRTLFPPPIGHAFQIPHDSEAVLAQFERWLAQSESGLAYIWLGLQPILLVTDAKIVEQVLRNPQFNTKGLMYNFLVPWLHTGLLTSTGEKWKRRRRLLTPAFHFAILKSYFETMKEQVETLLEVVKDQGTDRALDVRELITNCTLDIICETAMGVHPNAQRSGNNNEYVSAVKKSNELIMHRMAHPYLWPDLLYNVMPAGRQLGGYLKILHDYTRKTIKDRQKELEQTQPAWLSHLQNADEDSDGEEREKIEGKLPLLDLLIATSIYSADSGVSIDVRGIQEEVDTFMFEGHDTTANALIWSLQRIAEAPEVQTKIHAELDHVFGKGNHTKSIDFDDLGKLHYLEAVVKEVLRLYPPVPMLQRTVDVEGTTLKVGTDVLQVPKGLQITVIPYLLHREPSHFPNPNEFDPERFTRETLNSDGSTGRHPYAYVPFSAGPRNCIGQKFALMEEKTLLAQVLRKYRIVPEQVSEDVGLKPDLILRPRRPVMVKFIPRS